jgi:hypothetical protein
MALGIQRDEPNIREKLLAFMPELRTLCRRKAAALAGILPIASNSGKPWLQRSSRRKKDS